MSKIIWFGGLYVNKSGDSGCKNVKKDENAENQVDLLKIFISLTIYTQINKRYAEKNWKNGKWMGIYQAPSSMQLQVI